MVPAWVETSQLRRRVRLAQGRLPLRPQATDHDRSNVHKAGVVRESHQGSAAERPRFLFPVLFPGIADDRYDNISPFVPLIHVAVRLDDLFQRIAPVDDRSELPCFQELFQEK
jgi:hypothetical protein